MNIIHISCFLIFAMIADAFAESKAEEKAAWFAERREMIDRAKEISDEQTIQNLSRIVRGVGMHLPTASDEAKELYFEARTLLVAIPGHATYYGDRIKKARTEQRALVPNALDGDIGSANHGIKTAAFWNEKTYGFETLRHLPSPETVEVLGGFLSDEWISPIPVPVQDSDLEQSIAQNAANVLAVMPIVKKPTARIDDPTNPGVFIPDIKAWQQWFEQIKAGKRTFKFEGDSTEYTLAGPATQEALQRIERDRKRDEERLAGHRRSRSVSDFVSQSLDLSKASSVAGLTAALALVAAAVWYFWRSRSKA